MAKGFCLLKRFFIAGLVIFQLAFITGCLSSYNERSALTPALFFEKENKSVIFTIVNFGKASSYEKHGGIEKKLLSTSYYIQANDAVTGEKIAEKKIKHNSAIKFHPITTLGTGGGKAWLFLGEIMAFDPFTLELFADKSILESRNPSLLGKMPDERKYYNYLTATDEIVITATDGLSYLLNTGSLTVTAINEDSVLKTKKGTGFSDDERRFENLQRGQKQLNNLGVCADTINGNWFGLMNTSDISNFNGGFNYRNSSVETSRNYFVSAAVLSKDSSKAQVELKIATPQKVNDVVYLQGSFLLNKKTGLPIHLISEDGFIICYRNKTSTEASIILSRIKPNGDIVWTIDTGLNEFNDWLFEGNYLIIFGNDNKEISFNTANVMLRIDLQKGDLKVYDFFTDNMRNLK